SWIAFSQAAASRPSGAGRPVRCSQSAGSCSIISRATAGSSAKRPASRTIRSSASTAAGGASTSSSSRPAASARAASWSTVEARVALGALPLAEPAAPGRPQVAASLVEDRRALPVLEDAALGVVREALAEPLDAGADQRRLEEVARDPVEVAEREPLLRIGE